MAINQKQTCKKKAMSISFKTMLEAFDSMVKAPNISHI